MKKEDFDLEKLDFMESLAKAVDEALEQGSLSMAAIARCLNLSEQSFRRRLRKYASQTPKAFVSAIQMRRASELLLETPELPVAKVAVMCGFENSSSFCHKFKAVYGTSPSIYRRMQILEKDGNSFQNPAQIVSLDIFCKK